MRRWVSPVPSGVGVHCKMRLIRPWADGRVIAWNIAERAWKGRGVRLYRWPCGTMAVVPVDSRADHALEEHCAGFLFATYTAGVRLVDIMHDLNWARSRA